MRTETGLPFASGQAGVTVEVIDGVSEPLVEIAREHPDPIAWWIFLNRPKSKPQPMALMFSVSACPRWSEFADSTADRLGAYFNRLPRLRYQRIGELTSKSQTAKPPGFDTDGFAFVPKAAAVAPRSLTRHSAGLSNWECGLFTSSPATLPRLRRQSSPTGKL